MKLKPDWEESLVKLFSSTSRARILSLLYANIDKSFYQSEIMFETGLSLQATQRELSNLVNLGIIERRDAHARVFYQINQESPFFKPLEEISASSFEK